MAESTSEEKSQAVRGPAQEPERNWVDRLGDAMEYWVPDALTTAIGLLVILMIWSLCIQGGSLDQSVEAYYGGLWKFLQFTMQMTLIMVLSLIVSATPIFKHLVLFFARAPKNQFQVLCLASICGAVLAYLNWGLSLALSPIIAIHFCREAERKGIEIDFLFLLALQAGVGSIWQFGLSASAPLVMASPDQDLVKGVAVMPLASTIWSVASIAHVLLFLVSCIIAGYFCMPRRVRPISEFGDALRVAESSITSGEAANVSATVTPAQRLEQSSLVIVPLALMLLSWIYYHFFVKGLGVDINSMITILLLAAVVLQRNVANFQHALKEAVALSWPIVVLYHLYSGVASLIHATPVGDSLVGVIAPISTAYTFPLLTIILSTFVAIFIPTSGGQWAIQGEVTSAAAEAIGVTPQRALLALSVGDHMGNLITPFWAVVGANIARVDFRLIFGYRLIFAALWFVVGAICFTFLPC